MKRVKKAKSNSKLSKKQKNEIAIYIMKKIMPRYVALVLVAVKYEFDAKQDAMKRIIERVNRYTAAIDAGMLSMEEIKRNLESDIGIRIEDVFGDGEEFKKTIEE